MIMKNLSPIKFTDIDPDKKYLILIEVYERFSEGVRKVIEGSGHDVIEILKTSFLYDEEEHSNLKDFLSQADDMNGDGFDYVQVFLL